MKKSIHVTDLHLNKGGGDHNTLPEPGDILTEREDPSGNGESVHSSSANMFGNAVNFG